MITFETIGTYQQFADLCDAWNDLLSDQATEDVFMRHEWFDCWIRSREEPVHLCIVTGWQDGRLVAIAPLQRRRVQMKSIAVNTLQFLQSGVSPRCNFVAVSDAVLEALLDHVRSLGKWDILIAENMEEAQPISRSFLNYLNSRRISHHVTDGFVTPLLSFQGTWDDYLASLSANRRRSIRRRYEGKLKEAGDYAIDFIRTCDDFERVYPIMLDVSRRSWKGDEGTAVGQIKAVADFYRYFTPLALRNGWAQVVLLQVNGRPIAFEYCLTWGGSYHLIRSDYDKDYADYQPGENLKIAVIRDALMRRGRAEVDFGGVPDLYKMRWCNHIRRHQTTTVSSGSLRGRLILLWKNRLAPLLSRAGQESVTPDQNPQPERPRTTEQVARFCGHSLQDGINARRADSRVIASRGLTRHATPVIAGIPEGNLWPR